MLKLVQLLIKDKKHFALDLKAGQVKEVKLLEKDGAVVDILKIQYNEIKRIRRFNRKIYKSNWY